MDDLNASNPLLDDDSEDEIDTTVNDADNPLLDDEDDSIVIGGALLNLSNVLDTAAGQNGRVTFLNSVGDGVQWANTYASFQKIYNNNNEDETPDDIDLAKRSGGSVEFKLADCYRVKAKA